jgi:D-alanyl-D-alanine carboxypeptidase
MYLVCRILVCFLLISTVSYSLAGKKAAIVVDYTNGRKVLFAQSPDAKRYPASLTKIMTIYLLFEAIKKKKISFNTRFNVSKLAAQQMPSKLWLKPGDKISVRDLIEALVVKSANDAAVTAAEGLAGSISKFCALMNKKGRKLGLKHSCFMTPAGTPHPKQVSTARDLVKLGMAIYRDFPKYWNFFSKKEFRYNGVKHTTHSKILHWYNGADGAKTGYTCMSGYNLFVTANRCDKRGKKKRLFVVVMGEPSGKIRDLYAAQLMNKYLVGFDLHKKASQLKDARKSLFGQLERENPPKQTKKKPKIEEPILHIDDEIMVADIATACDVSRERLDDIYEVDEEKFGIEEEFLVHSKQKDTPPPLQ